MSRFSFFRWGKSKSDADRSSGDSGRFVADSVDRKKVPEQNSSSDPHLPEKKRARRRLVGSVTLVLAAIIVLPMIFESKPKQATPDLLIDIPSRDKSLQTAANSQAVTSSADVAGAADAPASSGQSPTEGIAPVSRPEQDAGQAATPAQTAVSVKDDTVSPVQEKPSAVQDQEKDLQRKAAEKQARAEKEKQLKAEKARQEKAKADEDADPIGKMIADKNNASAKSDKQMIQVAALASQQKVTELQARLSKAGIRSHTQKVKAKNGEERIRVRVGPLSSRGEVDSVCSKLKAMGLSCTLVSN